MTIKVKLIAYLALLITLSFGPACSSGPAQSNHTNEPALPNNPITDLDSAIEVGKPLFVTNCASCHGIEGRGDGISGLALPTRPRDLTSDNIRSAPDGRIFLALKNGVIREGKLTMPPVRNLTDLQLWQIIIYVRTLKKIGD